MHNPTVAPTTSHSKYTSSGVAAIEHWTSESPVITQAPNKEKDITSVHDGSPRNGSLIGLYLFPIKVIMITIKQYTTGHTI